MIRTADKFDLPQIVEMLRHYRSQSPLECLRSANNEQYILSLLSRMLAGAGLILVAEKEDSIVGMILAVKVPNIWDPDILSMTELAYWVEPEHRNSTIGYRLLQEYRSHCEKSKDAGSIEYYTISKMVNSPDLDYSRFGFYKLEEVWRN